MFSNSCNLNFHCLAPKDSGSDSEVLSDHGIKSEPVILNVYDMVCGNMHSICWIIDLLFPLLCTLLLMIVFPSTCSIGWMTTRRIWELAFITRELRFSTQNSPMEVCREKFKVRIENLLNFVFRSSLQLFWYFWNFTAATRRTWRTISISVSFKTKFSNFQLTFSGFVDNRFTLVTQNSQRKMCGG